MQDTQLFSLALGLDGTPWFVKEVRLDPAARRLDLELDFKPGTRFLHPITSQPSPVHDTEDTRDRTFVCAEEFVGNPTIRTESAAWAAED